MGPGCFSGSFDKAPWCQAEQAAEYVGLESRREITAGALGFDHPHMELFIDRIAKVRFSVKELENGNKIPQHPESFRRCG